MTKIKTYRICQGLWNPADETYSWNVVEEYDADGTIKTKPYFLMDCFLLGIDPEEVEHPDELRRHPRSRAKITQLAKDVRKNYDGPPLVMMEVTSQMVEALGNREEPFFLAEAEPVPA